MKIEEYEKLSLVQEWLEEQETILNCQFSLIKTEFEWANIYHDGALFGYFSPTLASVFIEFQSFISPHYERIRLTLTANVNTINQKLKEIR